MIRGEVWGGVFSLGRGLTRVLSALPSGRWAPSFLPQLAFSAKLSPLCGAWIPWLLFKSQDNQLYPGLWSDQSPQKVLHLHCGQL